MVSNNIANSASYKGDQYSTGGSGQTPPKTDAPPETTQLATDSTTKTFHELNVAKKEWKGWQVFLMVLTFPLSIPVYLTATAVNRCLTDNLLLDARSKHKPVDVRQIKQAFIDNQMHEVSFDKKRQAMAMIDSKAEKFISTIKEIFLNDLSAKDNAGFNGNADDKSDDKFKKLNEFSNHPKFLANVSKNYTNAIIKKLNTLTKQPSKKVSAENLLKLIQDKKNDPAAILDLMSDGEHQKLLGGTASCDRALMAAVREILNAEADDATTNKPAGGSPVSELEMAKSDFIARHQEVTIETFDKVKLNGFSIRNKDQLDKPATEQKWVIHFVGKDDCYENRLDEFKNESEQTGVNILTINYRGVGESQDSVSWHNHLTQDDLVLDGLAAVDHLLKKEGVPKENITIHGHSQGGAVAAQVTALHPGMNIVVDRSFTKYTDAIKGLIGGLIGKIAALFSPSWWEFNSVKALEKVTGHVVVMHHEKDAIIDTKIAGLTEKNLGKGHKGNPIKYINISEADTGKGTNLNDLDIIGVKKKSKSGLAAHAVGLFASKNLTPAAKALADNYLGKIDSIVSPALAQPPVAKPDEKT